MVKLQYSFYTFACGATFMLFCHLLTFFSKSTFSNDSFRKTIRMSNSLDQDQIRHIFLPVLGQIKVKPVLNRHSLKDQKCFSRPIIP